MRSHHVMADVLGIFEQPFALNHVERGQGSRDAHRVPSERRCMRARNPVHDLGAAQGDAERHARSDAFGHTDDVRLNASMLDRPPLAGAPDAALHLVDHQQNAVTVADATKFLHKNRGRDDVAAFPLNGLDENGGNFLGCEGGLEQLFLNQARAA